MTSQHDVAGDDVNRPKVEGQGGSGRGQKKQGGQKKSPAAKSGEGGAAGMSEREREGETAGGAVVNSRTAGITVVNSG